MTTDDLPFPLSGSTLITGPSGAGKTKLTYTAIVTWLNEHTPETTVIFDFAPEVERDNRILGGRLSRFGPLPDTAWKGIMDAHAPRAEGSSIAASTQLAKTNAKNATRIIESAPTHPEGVFVNDTTIPFQSEQTNINRFTAYCDRAECAVLNAFNSTELGSDDPVSTQEQHALDVLTSWADRTISLPPPSSNRP